jgi:hypothetical protein
MLPGGAFFKLGSRRLAAWVTVRGRRATIAPPRHTLSLTRRRPRRRGFSIVSLPRTANEWAELSPTSSAKRGCAGRDFSLPEQRARRRYWQTNLPKLGPRLPQFSAGPLSFIRRDADHSADVARITVRVGGAELAFGCRRQPPGRGGALEPRSAPRGRRAGAFFGARGPRSPTPQSACVQPCALCGAVSSVIQTRVAKDIAHAADCGFGGG